MAMPSRSRRPSGTLSVDRHVPAADEQRSHGADLGIESGGDAPLNAAHVCFGRRNILLAREQQRDVDRHAREDRFLDRGKSLLGAGDLDEQIGASRARMQFLGRGERAAVSCASRGETSSDTHPSTPLVGSWIGRNRSAACLRSSSASSKNSASPDLPSFNFWRMASRSRDCS